jgi:hypothetical protein
LARWAEGCSHSVFGRSGFLLTGKVRQHEGLVEVTVLSKPYRRDELARSLRSVLSGGS